MEPMTSNGPVMLRNSDLTQVARVCARAFKHAPHIEYFFPDESRRESDCIELFKMRIRYGLLYGEVHATSQDLEGIAVWIPSSHAHMTTWRQIRAGGVRLQSAVGNDAVARMIRVGKHNDELRSQVAVGRHMLLSILAIDPERQHCGHATRLVDKMLGRLDADRIPCYAETTEQGLLSFYQRLGFQPGDESAVSGANLPVWPMVRLPSR
jgi:ribosomal protein S18 acetylase RimI-like enzyme